MFVVAKLRRVLLTMNFQPAVLNKMRPFFLEAQSPRAKHNGNYLVEVNYPLDSTDLLKRSLLFQ